MFQAVRNERATWLSGLTTIRVGWHVHVQFPRVPLQIFWNRCSSEAERLQHRRSHPSSLHKGPKDWWLSPYKRKVTGSKPVAGIIHFVCFTEAHKGALAPLMYKPLPWWTLNIVGYAFDPFGPNNWWLSLSHLKNVRGIDTCGWYNHNITTTSHRCI